MKKKLYYVVEKELIQVGEVEETSGHKNIQVYEIQNNVPVKFFDLEVLNEEDSLESMQEYLDENGFGDESFEFIVL
jgi:hypothetical protein